MNELENQNGAEQIGYEGENSAKNESFPDERTKSRTSYEMRLAVPEKIRQNII